MLAQYKPLSLSSQFKRRVENAREIILRANELGRMVVSTSWGKDSVVLCHLVQSTIGPCSMVHIRSPASMPGHDRVQAWFEQQQNKIYIAGKNTSLADYIEWLRVVGLPHERTRAEHARVVTTLKRDVGSQWADENGFDVICMGMRIAERGPRARVLKKRGPIYQISDGTWRVNPLWNWSTEFIWAYIAANNVPYNHEIYDNETHGFTRETLRNTGWMSTDGAENGSIAWLRYHHPKLYDRLVQEFPKAARYK